MKIRMITLAAGPRGVFSPGKVYTVEDAVGDPMVAGNYAVRLDAPVRVVADAETTEPVMGRVNKPIDKSRRGKR